MGEQRVVVTILSFEKLPQGEKPNLEGSEIKRLLDGTDPGSIDRAGLAYHDLARKVKHASQILATHAPRIIEIWKGPDASLARTALQMLHASGNELASKLGLMGNGLQSYVSHLNTAKTEANQEVTLPSASAGGPDGLTPSLREQAKKNLATEQAQEALHKLNQQIVSIFDFEIPHDVSYELPTVNLAGGPPDTRDTRYPTGTTTDGPTFRPVSDTGGGSYGGGGTGGSGSTNPGSGGTGGAPNPGGSDPGGSDPNNPTDPTNPDPNQPGSPNDPSSPGDPSNPGIPTTPNPGQNPGAGNGDGTVPPVIGDQNRTTTDGTNTADPRQTDMASYRPPTSTFTPTTMPPATTINPPGYTVPTLGGGSPGIPSVIGSPGIGGQSPLGGPGGRGVGGASGGMPFMPLMGGGAGVGESGDLERNTYVPEDASCWTTSHDTTDPVIG